MHTSGIIKSLNDPLTFSAAAPIPIVDAEGAVPRDMAAATAVAPLWHITRPCNNLWLYVMLLRTRIVVRD